MKLNRLFAVIFFSTITFSFTYAQKISDEELTKYRIVMDSLEVLKNQLTVTINTLSKGSKISHDRFNKLMPIINDQAKLSEAHATADEIEHVKKAVAIRNEETIKFQKAYQELIYDYLGE